MDEQQISIKEQILSTIKEKAILKQVVYDQTRFTFKLLKKILQDTVNEYNAELRNDDERVLLEFRDRGTFEAELKVAGDLIVFHMHSNVFEFPRNHEIWKDSYYVERPLVTYSGIINFYNFLADSFKYNRADDLGYLIGRMFINKDATFFIEGRQELGFNYPVFDKNNANEENLKTLIESAISYPLSFSRSSLLILSNKPKMVLLPS